MSRVTIDEQVFEDIADAIREQLDVETTYKPFEMAAAIASISGGYPEPTGTVTITQNGTQNVKDYAEASVNVPNSYAAGDEGKVVSNGSLVSQGSDTVTENDTYDTTLISSLTVNVEGGGGTSDYELLEYIESDGTQGINLGRKIPASAYIAASFRALSGMSGYLWAFGAEYTSGIFAGIQYQMPNNRCYWHSGTSSTSDRGTIKYTDDVSTAQTTSSASGANIWLFALGRLSGDGYSSNSKTRLYYFRINDDAYIPCRRKSDNACGIWDAANSQFLADSLNGNAFVAGSVIANIGGRG